MEGSKTLEFRGLSAGEKYKWTETVLVRFSYLRLKKAEKGVIRWYIQKITVLLWKDRAQVSRLIRESFHGRTERMAEENRIQKTPVPQEVYSIRSSVISQNR